MLAIEGNTVGIDKIRRLDLFDNQTRMNKRKIFLQVKASVLLIALLLTDSDNNELWRP